MKDRRVIKWTLKRVQGGGEQCVNELPIQVSAVSGEHEMGRVIKGCFGLFIVAGVGVLGVSLWGMQQISAYEAMSPAQRAEVDRQVAKRAEADRRERLRGTECEKLDALACFETRRQRKNLEAAAEAWEKSDLKQAYDDAGVR